MNFRPPPPLSLSFRETTMCKILLKFATFFLDRKWPPLEFFLLKIIKIGEAKLPSDGIFICDSWWVGDSFRCDTCFTGKPQIPTFLRKEHRKSLPLYCNFATSYLGVKSWSAQEFSCIRLSWQKALDCSWQKACIFR